MHRDYTKLCRICSNEGSLDIFTYATNTHQGPLQRLLEKLRYVTMLKIDETDNLPGLLCDLCIVQLNVAYNFKRQAIENDTKLKQYFIENGISLQRTIPIAETTSTISSTFTNVHTIQTAVQSNFPIIPFTIKVEAPEYDNFSDATTVTNIDMNSCNRYQTIPISPSTSSSVEPSQNNEENLSTIGHINNYHQFSNSTIANSDEFPTLSDKNVTIIPSDCVEELTSNSSPLQYAPEMMDTSMASPQPYQEKSPVITDVESKAGVLNSMKLKRKPKIDEASNLSIEMNTFSGKRPRTELKKNAIYNFVRKRTLNGSTSKKPDPPNPEKKDSEGTSASSSVFLNPMNIIEQNKNKTKPGRPKNITMRPPNQPPARRMTSVGRSVRLSARLSSTKEKPTG